MHALNWSAKRHLIAMLALLISGAACQSVPDSTQRPKMLGPALLQFNLPGISQIDQNAEDSISCQLFATSTLADVSVSVIATAGIQWTGPDTLHWPSLEGGSVRNWSGGISMPDSTRGEIVMTATAAFDQSRSSVANAVLHLRSRRGRVYGGTSGRLSVDLFVLQHARELGELTESEYLEAERRARSGGASEHTRSVPKEKQ